VEDETSVSPGDAFDDSALESADTGDQLDTGATERQSSQDTTDWRAEAERLRRERDNYENRFKGLQPVVQQSVERARALELEKMRLEAALQVAQLPEDQQQSAWAYAQYQIQQQQLAQQQQAWQQQQQIAYFQLNEMARQNMLHELSIKYGIPKEKLQRFSTYNDVMAYIEDVNMSRTQRKTQRAAAGADHMLGGSGSVSRPPKKPETFDEARAALKRGYRFVRN
jgi:hypothetical protein